MLLINLLQPDRVRSLLLLLKALSLTNYGCPSGIGRGFCPLEFDQSCFGHSGFGVEGEQKTLMIALITSRMMNFVEVVFVKTNLLQLHWLLQEYQSRS